jgi:hypothetical protein
MFLENTTKVHNDLKKSAMALEHFWRILLVQSNDVEVAEILLVQV